MRFIVVLGLAVSLASAAALTPIERRQCSTQRDGCCLKQGTCQTCYFGDEPYDCNCECLEYGLCPCTGTYHGECFSWYSPDGHSTAKAVAANLINYYHGNAAGHIPGLLDGPPPDGDYYWWTGSVLWSTLIEYWHYTGDAAYNNQAMTGLLFQTGQDRNYMPANQTLTEGSDDQGLWGLAAMLAAERKFPNPPADQPQWLALAQNVFSDLAARWDAKTCNGGLRWQIAMVNNGYNYKNSISTGVLLNLGARLQTYTGNKTYGDWADKSWTWAEEIGFIGSSGSLYDGAHTNENCSDINKVEYSYVSAIYILSAAHMFNTTGDAKWKNRLDTVSAYSLKHFIENGAVFEPACETAKTCTSDMTLFKGIYHQMLSMAAQMAPSLADAVLPVLQKSAAAAVKTCTGADNACGFSWTNGTFDNKASAAAQMNALSAVSALLAKAGDAPSTSTTGGTSTSGGTSGNSTGSNGGNNSGSGDAKGGNGGRNSATRVGGNAVLGLVLACVVATLL